MAKIKKAALTVTGVILVAIGLVFIILPGPAILFIPLGLVLLAMEYSWAENWLRRYQRWSAKTARELDSAIYRWRNRQRK